MSANEERITLFEFMPYGAPELLESAKKYMFRGTVGGIGGILLFFLCFLVTNLILAAQEKAIPVVQMQVADLAAPPPLSQDTPPPQVQVAPAAAPPAAAIPVPVPDAEAPPEQTIMSQEEIANTTPGVAEGSGDQIVVAPPTEEEMPKLGEYVYVEELPEAITRVPPVYPDLAREAGVDGTVLVQALVDKSGKVRDVKVTKSIPMLDASALAAVKQWVFKPALSNNKPVAVWVAVPVKFSLH